MPDVCYIELSVSWNSVMSEFLLHPNFHYIRFSITYKFLLHWNFVILEFPLHQYIVMSES